MDLLVHLDWSVRKSTPRMWACHVANQSVECRLSTGLGHRHGIPSPGEAPCIPDGRVGVIGRVHAPTGWGEILGLAPAQVPVRSGRVLLDPRLSEDGNRRDLAAPARSRCLSESAEPLDAIGADLFGIGIALGCALGSAGCLETCAIARQPVGGPLVAEPIRGHERQIIARRTERFPPTCQAIERPDSGHDRGGVGARPSPSFPPATGVKPGQQDSEAHLFRSPWHQTCPKRGEDRVVNARIGELQPHGILPVETTAHRIRRLPSGQGVRTRPNGDSREAPRRFCRWPTRRIERAKGRLIIDRPQPSPPLHAPGGTWKSGLGHTPSFLGNRMDSMGSKGHDVSPSSREDVDGIVVTRNGP
jgi:hypothetical protein